MDSQTEKKLKAVVIYGEIPEGASKDELDTLDQVDVVTYALDQLGYETSELTVSLDMSGMVNAFKSNRPDIVFNLVESLEGRGSLIHVVPSIMDSLGIDYTGANTESIFLTTNKIIAKKFLQGAGIPALPWFTAENILVQPFAKGRYILKAVWEHASIGLDYSCLIDVSSREQLLDALKAHETKLGGPCFAEAFIEGREFNMSILAGGEKPLVMPPAEVRFNDYPPDKPKIVTYDAKWEETSFEYQNIVACFDFTEEDAGLLEKLKFLSGRCWDIFSLRGYARVDFRIDQEGNPWVMEVNINPCLSPDGGYAWGVEEAGLSFNEAIDRIIKDSLK
jgi:D-alanine-D-alanine ligase